MLGRGVLGVLGVVCGCATSGSVLMKGRVVDGDSQSGVDDVVVVARSSSGQSYTGMSNWNGEFRMSVEPGQYDVIFHHRNGATGYAVTVTDRGPVLVDAVIWASNIKERSFMVRHGRRWGDPLFFTKPTPHKPRPTTAPEPTAP